MRTQMTKAIANSGWNDAERQKFEQQIAADLKTIGAISERFRPIPSLARAQSAGTGRLS